MVDDLNALFTERPDLDSGYLAEADTAPDSLCFIVGCHRSGTTILYSLLASSPGVNYVSAYDVYYFPLRMALRKRGLEEGAKRFLQEKLDQMGSTRQLDSIPIGPDEPEEFGFILPEQKFLQPRLVPEAYDRFDELCRKKHWLDPKPTLIVKNPNEFYGNLLSIANAYPNARFLVVHRHPLLILHSQIRAWRQMVKERNPYFALLDPALSKMILDERERTRVQMLLWSDEGARWILNLMIQGFDAYQDHVRCIEPERVLDIRYEDLCRAQVETMDAIQRWIDIPPITIDPLSAISPRKSNPADIACRIYEERLAELRPYLESQGYSEQPIEHVS
jgi:hypothetical protein